MMKKYTFEVPQAAENLIEEAFATQSQLAMPAWLAQVVLAVSRSVLTEEVTQRVQQAAQEIAASNSDRGGSDIPDLPLDKK